ncbi:glycine betaine ABC transporter substrate-binding protein [Streptomyces boncukensis]|uniref:Glycine/betaine ABC transporter substrate-binding protein n=1 Tax=Streptomyces boncukensis TaxID=2711219 RepID=A0A6G4WXA5_9ACTN|nr:glycine betaine ABC transporter substrate-binding protein [Streptomyces boncukensis]NGO69260.1 glycine/betaine ABC transporter substrate-binding protein [Streptomyces boncukensis]
MSVITPSRAAALGLAVLAPLTLTACSSESEAASGPVVLTEPTWAGGQANVAVARHLLERELGYDVTVRRMEEKDAWHSVGKGKSDAILEDWGHPDLEQRYVAKKDTVVPAGDNGVTGKIGWYVPDYVIDKHPDLTGWNKLNKYAALFRTEKSGTKGQLLEGSRDFLTHDEALVKNLGLNYQPVYAGSESKQIKEIQRRTAKREPFLTYWWRPHWLAEEADLKEVPLPAHYEGCDEDADTVECGYPQAQLQKFLNKDFSENGGNAAKFLKNFQWSESDQNKVARMISKDGLSPKAAARKWIDENPGTWKVWLWGLKKDD